MAATAIGYDSGVSMVTKLFRLTATFLLLFIGVEMATCETPNSPCSILNVQVSGTQGSDQVSPAKHSVSAPELDDNCICCCAHSLVQTTVNLAVVRLALPSYAVQKFPVPLSSPSEIEHPPQLS